MSAEIISHQPEPQRPHESLSIKDQEFLVKSALKYRETYASMLPEFKKGGMQIALSVVTQIYLEAKGENVPKSNKERGDILDRGYESRKRFFSITQDFFDTLGGYKEEFALPTSEIQNGYEEFNQRFLRVDFPAINNLMKKVEERTSLVPQLSELFLSSIMSRIKPVTQAELHSYLRDTKRQSMVIRGVVTAMIGRLLGVHSVNPVFITDENINDIISKLEDADIEKVISQTSESLSSRLPQELGFEALTSTFSDFAHQVVDAFVLFNKAKKHRNLTPQTLEYWKTKQRVLNILPSTILTPDIEYVYSKEMLPQAITENHPHIWEENQIVRGMVIPTVGSIEKGLKVLHLAGFSLDTPEANRLIEARKELVQFNKILPAIRREISFNEKRIQVLEKYFEHNVDLNTVEDLPVRILKTKKNKLKDKLRGFILIQTMQQEYRDSLRELEEIREATDSERLVYLSTKNDREITQLTSRIRFLQKRLSEPGWHHFLSPEDSKGSDYITEYGAINAFLDELQENSSLRLPTVFSQDQEYLKEFIMSEFPEILKSFEKRSIQPFMIRITKSCLEGAKGGIVDWHKLSVIFKFMMKERATNLLESVKLQKRKNELHESSRQIKREHNTGELTPEVQFEVDHVVNTQEENFIRAFVCIDEEIRSISKSDFENAQEISNSFARVVGISSIRLEQSAGIKKQIDELILSEHKKLHPDSELIRLLSSFETIMQNPLFPTENIEGLSMAQAMEIFRHRIAYAETVLFGSQKQDEFEELLPRLEKAVRKEQWNKKRQEYQSKLKILQRRRRALSNAELRLILTFEKYGLAIPEDEFMKLSSH